MMKKLLCVLFLSLMFVRLPARAADPATTLLTTKAALTELKSTLEGLLIGADFATQKKIEGLIAQTTGLVKEIERLQRGAVTDINKIADNVGRPTAELLRSVQELVGSTERQTFLDAATVSASVSNAIDALPLTKVKPFVAAIQPNRISSNPVDHMVKLYGWFGASDATLPVKIEMSGKSVDATPTVGGVRFALDIPANGFAEQSFVPIKIRIPHRTGMLFWKGVEYHEIADQIYVYNQTPFQCSYTKFLPNPDSTPQISANHEYEEWAATEGGRNRPSNNGSLSAPQLLINTVDNAQQLYDAARAVIAAPNCRVWSNGPCEHSNPSATWSWAGSVVNYSLSAPSVGGHWHATEDCHDTPFGRICIPGGYLHGGGGSHAHIACAPTFIAPKLGVPAQILGDKGDLTLGRRQSKTLAMSLPQDNWSVQLSCNFKDGDRSFQTARLILTPTNRAITISPLHGEITDAGELLVETQYEQMLLAQQ